MYVISQIHIIQNKVSRI